MAGTYTNLVYHLVFSTKKRIPLISQGLQKSLYKYIGGIIRGEGGTLLEIGGMPEHVHLLTKLKPTESLSEMLNRIKAKSSKWVNEEKMKLRKFGWQDGYAAFSVSQSQIGSVRKYIQKPTEAPSPEIVPGRISGAHRETWYRLRRATSDICGTDFRRRCAA
jgi:REP element-mobilizing transposase RayT